MKKILIIIIMLIAGIAGCDIEQDAPIDNRSLDKMYKDFDYQSVYFPVQLPLRTLSLGEDRVDNSLDKQYIFDIGVSVGGMYVNNQEWTVDYELDPLLTEGVYQNNTDLKIIPLPEQYYTLEPVNKVTIPKGLFNGRIRVQLTSEFFDDTLALTGQYVVPLRITDTSADTILTGKAAVSNADPRIKAHWESNKSPKDWVMYGIKYVNAYHGTYLHRGRDVINVTATGEHDTTIVFRNMYVEKDALMRLTTISRNQVISDGAGHITGSGLSMTLTFDNDKGQSGSVSITPVEGAAYEITGTGQYFDKSSSVEEWTLLTWQSMYLSYSYKDDTYTHNITDTLVFRDRGIKWEENVIKIEL